LNRGRARRELLGQHREIAAHDLTKKVGLLACPTLVADEQQQESVDCAAAHRLRVGFAWCPRAVLS
jgi:hypothetical protein